LEHTCRAQQHTKTAGKKSNKAEVPDYILVRRKNMWMHLFTIPKKLTSRAGSEKQYV